MFCTELKFASDCLMKCFNSKFKIGNMQLSKKVKRNYEVKNPINRETDRCCFFTFQLEINPATSDTTKEKMSYLDFVITKEHKFLRNSFSEDELSFSDALKNIQSYHS